VHSIKYLTSYVRDEVVKALGSGGVASLTRNLDTRLRYFTWTLSVIRLKCVLKHYVLEANIVSIIE